MGIGEHPRAEDKREAGDAGNERALSLIINSNTPKVIARTGHGAGSLFQDLSSAMIVDLPIRLKGNSKRTSGNSFSPLGAQNMDTSDASLSRYICDAYYTSFVANKGKGKSTS